MMRIAIVNDSPTAVAMLRTVIAAEAGFEEAWVAVDGAEAVEKCRADVPDIILMDLFMPVLDGVEASRQIMRETPCRFWLSLDRSIQMSPPFLMPWGRARSMR